MRKLISVSILFFILHSTYAPLMAQEVSKKPVKTIIIDPGHGGLDPGAVGLLQSEANVALAVSLKLGDAVATAFPEMKIIFTRTTV